MSNLIFVSGDFSSGSTLLFTLFRKTGAYHCLYEPLHEKLPEYLIWPLQVSDHHYHVDNYFKEYQGLDRIPDLFDPAWGNSDLHLHPEDEADDLYRYLSYLVGMAFGRRSRVMLQFNRATFRLGWLRRQFPRATIVHIYRDKQKQWNSIVRRVQEHHGREDVGQDDPSFTGFNIARWCENLKDVYPELDASNSETGYERFSKLWELSYAEHQRFADLSIRFGTLIDEFESTSRRLWDCVEYDADIAHLKEYVVRSEQRNAEASPPSQLRRKGSNLVHRASRKYAQIRLKARSLLKD